MCARGCSRTMGEFMDGEDVLRAGVYGLWILVCMTCVVSFCLCLYWMTKGNHPLILALRTPFKPNWKQKVLLGGAAIFLLVAMYRGGTAFFAWIPESWGTIDEDGDFRTYQEALGGAIGSICGLVLLAYLNEVCARPCAQGCDRRDRVAAALVRRDLAYGLEGHAAGSRRIVGEPREDATGRRQGLGGGAAIGRAGIHDAL
jgi:hypothetical protein